VTLTYQKILYGIAKQLTTDGQRVLFIAHLAFGIPFALVIIAAPFVGLWQIIFGDAITGVVTMVAGLGIWIASAVVNRF